MQRFRKYLPAREALLESRWMRWFPAFLHHPRLWHWSRRGVALGVGIGLFFGLIIPTAQIPFSAVAAALLRANLPAAAASTLVSNPVTTPPIYYAAYRIGDAILGVDKPAVPAPVTSDPPDTGIWDHLMHIGPSLFLGLAIFASLAGIASYVLISVFWYVSVMRKRRSKGLSRPASSRPIL